MNPAWCEVDTVGLLSAEPLPEGLRTHVTLSSAPTRTMLGCLVMSGVVAAIGAAGWIATSASRGTTDSEGAPARPALVVAGTTIGAGRPGVEELAQQGVIWASQLGPFSSEYQADTNGARQVLDIPDVYPSAGDLPRAWAPRDQDAGYEWITVSWPIGVDARALVWIETLNPGAVVRVDDLTDPSRPAVLFEGIDPSAGRENAVVTVGLPSPRRITTVRLVLDTRKVAGWNEIDAIGLVP